MSRITEMLDRILEATTPPGTPLPAPGSAPAPAAPAPKSNRPRQQPVGNVDNAMYGYCRGITSDYGVNIIPQGGGASAVWKTWVQYALKGGYIAKPEFIQMAKEQPLELVRRIIEFYDGCFVVVVDGELRVFSRRSKANLPSKFIEKIHKFTPELAPYSPVWWFKTMTAKPEMVTAAGVLYGMDNDEAQYQAGKTEQHRASLSPGKRSELRRQFWSPGGFDPDTAPDIVDKLLK